MKFPTKHRVYECLRDIWRTIRGYGDVDETDVRLQVMPDESWDVHYGDASYDQDHRGYWGASSIAATNDRSDLVSIAESLLEQSKDAAVEAGETIDGED